MLATARLIVNEYGGKFPNTYEQLLTLKGIGPYTTAAIASFAFGAPQAIINGDVWCAVSVFRISSPYDTTDGKKTFAKLAQELLDTEHSAAYNQAIMDLGATVCTPRNTRCGTCPLIKKCIAYDRQMVALLPVKSKKQKVRIRYFNYILFRWKDTLWIHKRRGNDIWENLHEPYLIETEQLIDSEQLTKHTSFEKINTKDPILTHVGSTTQRLTHQIIEARFFSINLNKRPTIADTMDVAKVNELNKTAFPKTVVSFFKNNLYF